MVVVQSVAPHLHQRPRHAQIADRAHDGGEDNRHPDDAERLGRQEAGQRDLDEGARPARGKEAQYAPQGPAQGRLSKLRVCWFPDGHESVSPPRDRDPALCVRRHPSTPEAQLESHR